MAFHHFTRFSHVFTKFSLVKPARYSFRPTVWCGDVASRRDRLEKKIFALEIRPPKSLPRLSYELYSFWEEVLANESQALMMHWKYGKKGPEFPVIVLPGILLQVTRITGESSSTLSLT